MPTNDVVLDKVLIKGGNSGFAVEMDLGIIHTVLQWFVSEAPKEMRSLHNVGRAIRFNDQLIELLDKEKKSSLQYIEKKIVEEGGIPDSQYTAKGTGVFKEEGKQLFPSDSFRFFAETMHWEKA